MAPSIKNKWKIIKPKTRTTIDKVGGIYCNICNIAVHDKRSYEKHYKEHATGNIIYSCVLCYKDSKHYRDLRSHCYTIHLLKAQSQCRFCEKSFSNLTALKEHQEKMHLQKYVCPKPCNKTFKTAAELKTHAKTHMIEAVRNCHSCNEEIDSQETCKKHIEAHIVYQYPCPICDDTFSDKPTARDHLQKHFKDEAFYINEIVDDKTSLDSENCVQISCSECKILYNDKKSFDEHYSTKHNSEPVYCCGFCLKKYNHYNNFSNHWYNHSMKDRYECDVCEKTFPRIALLVLHMEATHVTNTEKPFECLQCGQGFCTDKSLKSHLLVAHGILYQICPQKSCGKMFDSPAALIFHQMEHKNDSSVKQRCGKCGLAFKNLSACFKHIEVHKKKTFTCPICCRKYGERRLMIKHIPQHYQTVFHSCQYCEKIYSLKSRLLEHVKTHTNLTFKCNLCDKSFPSYDRLQQHLNVHTGASPFKCIVCEKSFKAAPNLRKHLKRMHGDFKLSFTNNNSEINYKIPIANGNNIKSVMKYIRNNANGTKSIDDLSNGDSAKNGDNPPQLNSEANSKMPEINGNIQSVINNNAEIDFDDIFSNKCQEDFSINTNDKNINITDNITNDDFAFKNIPLVDDDVEINLDIAKLEADNKLVDIGITTSISLMEADNAQTTALPCEYGPDFVNNRSTHTFEYGNQVINLEDSVLPHVDPYLLENQFIEPLLEYTNLQNASTNQYESLIENYNKNVADTNFNLSWETSLVNQDYSYVYNY